MVFFHVTVLKVAQGTLVIVVKEFQRISEKLHCCWFGFFFN